jgi:hypothetical protein
VTRALSAHQRTLLGLVATAKAGPIVPWDPAWHLSAELPYHALPPRNRYRSVGGLLERRLVGLRRAGGQFLVRITASGLALVAADAAFVSQLPIAAELLASDDAALAAAAAASAREAIEAQRAQQHRLEAAEVSRVLLAVEHMDRAQAEIVAFHLQARLSSESATDDRALPSTTQETT